jgi:hypothetical protein
MVYLLVSYIHRAENKWRHIDSAIENSILSTVLTCLRSAAGRMIAWRHTNGSTLLLLVVAAASAASIRCKAAVKASMPLHNTCGVYM